MKLIFVPANLARKPGTPKARNRLFTADGEELTHLVNLQAAAPQFVDLHRRAATPDVKSQRDVEVTITLRDVQLVTQLERPARKGRS